MTLKSSSNIANGYASAGHPVKRSENGSARALKIIFHSAVVALHAYTYYFLVQYVTIPPRTTRHVIHGRWKYLTHWNFALQLGYFTICLVRDILGTDIKLKGSGDGLVNRYMDSLFHGIVFPLGTYVFAAFWGIYAIDRELIFPKILDSIFPSWVNHVIHTVILFAVLVEAVLVYHRQPTSTVGLTILSTVYFTYTGYSLWLALVADVWVYPFMEVMNWPARILSIFVFYSVWLMVYRLGGLVHSLAWSAERRRSAIRKQTANYD